MITNLVESHINDLGDFVVSVCFLLSPEFFVLLLLPLLFKVGFDQIRAVLKSK